MLAVCGARHRGLKMPMQPDEMIPARALSECRREGNIAESGALPAYSKDKAEHMQEVGNVSNSIVGTIMVNEDHDVHPQLLLVRSQVAAMCRVTGGGKVKAAAAQYLACVVQYLCTGGVLFEGSVSFKSEVELLHDMVRILSTTSNLELSELERNTKARGHVITHRSGPFFKALTLFPNRSVLNCLSTECIRPI